MASVRKRKWTTGGETKTAWVVDYLDQGGSRRQKTFDKKKDADAWMIGALHQVSRGTHTPDSVSLSVREAGRKWLEQNDLDQLERSTIEQREAHLRLHINPRIGDVKLSKLTGPSVTEFGNALLRDMSRPMAVKVLRSLRMLLNFAMGTGLVAQNAASVVKISTRDREDQDVVIPTKAQFNALLAKAEGRWRPLLVTAAFTGMRASELRGLTWDNVDFERRIIRVTQRADKWGTIGNPKSKTSRREIPITPLVESGLKEWKLACPLKKDGPDDPGRLWLVFPNTRGNVEMLTNIIRRFFHPAQIATGLIDRTGIIEKVDGADVCLIRPLYGFHAMRHFYASWLIEQAFTAKRVQSLLGHSSIQMTFDVYGHLFPNAEDDHSKLAKAEAALLKAI